jgi:hypothetical protein
MSVDEMTCYLLGPMMHYPLRLPKAPCFPILFVSATKRKKVSMTSAPGWRATLAAGEGTAAPGASCLCWFVPFGPSPRESAEKSQKFARKARASYGVK